MCTEFGGLEGEIDVLLKGGSAVDLRDNVGRTVLLWRRMSGDKRLVKYLQFAEADVTVRDETELNAVAGAATGRHTGVFWLLIGVVGI